MTNRRHREGLLGLNTYSVLSGEYVMYSEFELESLHSVVERDARLRCDT
jgi:hypothetical protein